MMFDIGLAVTYLTLGDVAGAIAGLALVNVPLSIVVLQFTWFYRLELRPQSLCVMRFYGLGSKCAPIADIRGVYMRAPQSLRRIFAAQQLSFEWGGGSIPLMVAGEFWSKNQVRKIVIGLRGKGVYVDASRAVHEIGTAPAPCARTSGR